MAVYSYTATTLEGTIVEGVVEASDEKLAIEQLKNTGVIPIRVAAPEEGKKRKFAFRSTRGKLLTFTTELSALVGAGLPLDRSLNILSDISEGKEMKEVVQSVLKLIREGNAFSEAIQKHPDVFPKLYVSMVRAGEMGGVLDVILEKLNDFYETSKELRDSVLSAMIYPVILAITGGASIIVLLTFVIPQFSVMFKELGGTLPLSTQMILAFSNGIRSYWWVILPVFIVAAIALKSYMKTEKGSYTWDRMKLKLAGDVVNKLETARFCRTLGTLIKSGVPFLQALGNAREVVGNRIIADALNSVIKNVREGKGVAGPLAESGVLPPLALSMIKVGEETGNLDTMLLKVAVTYEKSLKEAVKRFMGLLEPALILIMGLAIAFIVVSMLIAIFSVLELPT